VKLIWHPLAMADRERIMDFIARDKPMSPYLATSE
jgi:plasmid stabilization system protein ParE